MNQHNNTLALIGRENKLFEDDIDHYKNELINIITPLMNNKNTAITGQTINLGLVDGN